MKKLEKGFTLVELMIVVAIIAILAAVALPSFGDQIKKSKDSKAVQMMGNMRSQVTMVQTDLEGMAPNSSFIPNMFTDAGASSVTGVVNNGLNVDVKGIQGYNKATSASNATSLKAGTPAAGIAWSYSADSAGDRWTLKFGSVSDTKKKSWADY